MNHIYKSIFNKALGVFTAVPEFASAHGKGSERAVVGRVAKGTAGFAASALAISVGLALTSTSAVAGPGIYINDGTDTGCLAIPDAQSPNVGIHGISGGAPVPGLSLLGPSQVVPDKSYYGLDVMKPCLSSTGTAAEERSTQTNRTLFYGGNSYTKGTITDNGAKNLTLGGRLDVNSGIIGVGDRGVNGTDATNSIRMGTGTTLADANKKLNSISIGVDTGASDANAIAIGANTSAAGSNSSAIGLNSKATTDSSIAIGTASEAGGPATSAALLGTKAVAIGYETKALGTSNVALGYGSVAENGHDSIAIGIKTKTSNVKSIAIGAYGEASGAQSTVISNNYGSATGAVSTASGTRSQVYGAETTVSGEQSVAIGDTNTVASSRTYAIGNNINVAAGASDSLVFGTKASVGGPEAIALGNTANSKTDGAISIGAHTVSGDGDLVAGVEGNKSISIGYESVANRYDTIAMGVQASTQAADSGVAPWDAVAIGSKAKATTYKALAIGAYSQATGRQSTVIGNDIQGQNSTASGTRSQILGVQSNVSGDNSVSIGDTNNIESARTYAMGNNINVKAGADDSLAFGTRAHVSGANQVSIGTDAGADNTSAGEGNTAGISIGNDAGRYATAGKNNTSIGQRAGQYANGDNNVAIGKDAGSLDAAGAPLTTNTVSIGSSSKVKGQEAIAVGNEAEAISNSAIAIGNSAKGRALYSTAIGLRAKTSDDATMTFGESATAVGHAAAATRYSAAAFGHDSFADGESSVALGYAAKALGTEQIAIGAHAGQNRQGTQTGANFSVAIGRSAGGDAASALGNHSGVSVGLDAGRYLQDGSRNTSVGGYAGQYVKGSYNVALGHGAGSGTATENLEASETISIGHNSKASAAYSTAIGSEAKAKGIDSIAMGLGATVEDAAGFDGIAIGTRAKAKEKGMAVGAYSQADGVESAVFANAVQGKGSTASGRRSSIIGVESTVSGNNSVAIGDTNTVTSDRTYAMGNNITTGAGAHDSLAFGSQAYVGNASAIAMGNAAKAVGKEQVSIGKNAGADSTNPEGNYYGVYIGSEAGRYQQGDGRNYAIGQNAGQYVKGSSNIALGTNAGKGDAGNVIDASSTIAIGRETKASGYSGISIGTLAETTHANSIALGDKASATNGHDALAVGAFSKTTAAKAMSIGSYSTASGAQSIVIASNYADSAAPEASNRSTATAARAIVMGPESHATAEDALAIGNKNTVASARTYAIGNNINVAAGADDSLAFGTRAAVGAANTVAIGANANAAQANSVALGAGSATSAPHTGNYTLNTSYTAAGQPNAANGTVSVGSAGKERQIQNVAAGVISATSTDAINGSQLHATNNYLSNLAGGVKNVLGGDAAVDNAGNLTMSNIGGTGKGNVNDAIAAANTKVAAGDNITVTPTTNTDGSKTYTVATKKDLVVDSVKAGDTTVNTDGVTITGGPSVKKDGINAGNKKITGVADGNVAAGSTDAVNGGQLAEVKAKADSAVQNVVSANPTALTATKAGDTVTLTPNFIAGDLVNADGTVNDPATADEGKLVSAKTVADALKANHFVVDTKANGGAVDAASEEDAEVGSGNKVTFEAGKNLVAQQTNTANGGATVNYKLSDTLENLVSVKSAEIEAGIGPNKVVLNNNGVKVGDSTLNDKGLTINNGPSVTDAGIDAGNKKITGVADGNVAAGSTDAVNGGQLAEVKSKADSAVQDVKSGDENALTAVKDPNTNIVTVTPKLSGDLVDTNGNITAPTTPEEKGKLVTAGTVAEALANTHFVVDTKATDGELDAASQADQKIKASNKVTLQAGKNLKAKQTNGANGAEVEFSLKDSISLKEVKVGEGSANEVVLNNNGVNVAGNTYINKDGLNANDKKITNVAPGAVTAASKDAVNGSQLYNVANNVKDLIGPDAAIDPATGKVTVADPAKGIGETGKGNIGDAIKHVNDAAKAAAETAAKHTTVVEGKNVKVTKGKNAAGGDEYTVATKDDLDVTSVTAGNTTVNTNGLTITGGPSVTRGGIDAGNRVISGVKAGDVSATSQEAVNGSQLHATNTKLDGVKAKADTAVQDVKSGDENALTAVKDPNTNIVTVTPKLSGDLVDANGNITAPTTPADKGKLVTAGTVADALANTHFVVDTKATDGELDAASQADQKIKASNKVTLQAGKNLKAKQTNGANGAQVEFSLKDSISLKEVTAGEGANQVVLNDKGVNVGGNTYINNAGLNANGNKITNVADGVDPKDAVNKGQLDAVKTVADSAVKSVDVANGEQNLVVDNSDPKNPKLSLKKDLIVDSVKAGDSTLNNDGLTIAGGPSVKKDGINAGDKTITNVAPGAVTAASKDAVNGGQLYNVANNVKDLIGPDAAIDPATGKVTVADPAKGIGETGKGNIGDAIKHVNDAAKAAADTAKKHTTVEQGDNIVVEESTNADGGKHYKVSTAKDLNVDSVKAGDTTVNNDGVTIAGGPSVTKGGINAGGNTITNVADGVNPNDAVNKGQLDAVKGVADSAVKSVDVANGEQNLVVDNSDPKNPKLSLKKDLTVDSVKAGDSTLNNDGLTIAGGPSVKKDGIDAGDKKITNVAAGDVAENSKDAVNGGQLHNVAKGVADVLGGDAAVDGNGKVTMTNIGETGKGNVNDAIKHVNDLAKNAADTAKKHTTVEQGDNIVVEESTNADGGKHYKVSTAKNLNVDSVKAGDTTVNNDGVTINNGPSMTKDGINANNTKVTNVADGVDAADAVNKGQLDKVDTKVSNVAQNVVNVLGGDATVNGNGDITMSNIGETGKGNINDAIKSVNDLAKKAAAEKTSVKAKEGRSNVTVTEGVNAAGGHEYTVDVERSVTNAGSDYVTVTNNHDADSNTTTYTVDVSAKTKASLAKADSAVQGLTSKDGNLNFTKGANGNVEVSFNDNLNVKNVTTDRVQVANGPSMSKDGINAAGKAISNVANGNVAADSKDAVNGGQLHETAKSVADVIGGGATVKDGKVVAGQNGIGNTGQNTVHGAIAAINQNTANNFNQIRGDLRKMDRDLRGGIAGALATAGLPQAFRPGKSMVAAAASTYRGQSGLAIGVSRISDNGKVILKVTGNTNSRGDFGGTIGAGYQW